MTEPVEKQSGRKPLLNKWLLFALLAALAAFLYASMMTKIAGHGF